MSLTRYIRCVHPIVAVTLVSGCVSPDHSTDKTDGLCKALAEFADEALLTSEIQESILIKEQPMQIGCIIETGDPAQKRYCDAVLASVGMEFTHSYPWQVRSCIRAAGGKEKTTTAPEYTGLIDRDKIISLEGVLRSGVKVEMAFTPSCETDAQMDPGGGCYWGRYRLSLTPPI